MFKKFSKGLGKICKTKNECECPKADPEPIDYSLIMSRANAQPKRQNPADALGLANKFCYFIPLKPGAFIVCFFSFVWSGAEIMGADKQIADIFPDRLLYFKVCKTVYMVLCIGLLLATCVLMIGVIQEKSVLINTYLWYTCLFTVLFLILTVLGLVFVTYELGYTPKRKVLRLVAVAMWVTLLGYFLVVVNSFKYTLW